MKQKRYAFLMALLLLLGLAACGGKSPPQDAQTDVAAPEITPTEPDAAPESPEDSAAPDDGAGLPIDADFGGEDGFSYSVDAAEALYDLQTYLTREPFAVAYLGYREEGDTTELSAWLHDNVPVLAATMPFVTEIPPQRTFGSYGDLYCIVPRGEDTTLWVNCVEWEELGNGARPNVTDALYESDHAEPVLVFVTHGAWRDETDTVIRATTADGDGIEWYPLVDLENGGCTVPVDMDGVPFLFDFSHLYDVGDYIPYLNDGSDAAWLPPTELGLANTTWYSDNGWMLAFDYNESGIGNMVLYQPVESADGTSLSPYYDGTWWIEDDGLCLGIYDGRCPFPLLISPSGERLVVMQAEDGSVLPFFEKGQARTTLTLSYG